MSSTSIVHLKRHKGQIVQDCDVYIGRAWNIGGWSLPKSKWANPFCVKKHGRDQALELYKQHILSNPELVNSLHELKGKVLGCWCKPEKCHGDVLIELLQQHM